jgi:glycosyltransferase involved in cell wall biosynthesis
VRILVVTTWFPSADRPSEAPFNLEHVRAIAQHHDVRVIHVSLMGTASPRMETYEGVRVRRLPFSPRNPLAMLRSWHDIRRAMRQADILHTMAFSSVLVAAPAHALTRRAWVHTEHWNGVSNPASVGGVWPRVAWLRHALRLPHRLTGVTSQLTAVLAGYGRPNAASTVPCVVENRMSLHQPRFGDRVELVAVGALVARKQPLMAVETLHWLREHSHPAHLTWVGDGPLAGETAELAARLGVSDDLTLVGNRPPGEIFERIAAADLFFLPTAQENFFTSAAEALSSGRAVVVPLVGGYDDYVDESNSVIVHENTPEAYGRGIRAAVERFAALDVHAIADPIRERFSRKAIGQEFDRVYAAALRKTPPITTGSTSDDR